MASSSIVDAVDDSKKSHVEELGITNHASKRLACMTCRERKIRCDRKHPTCGRCAKMGTTCRYLSRSKPTPSKLDLSRYLVTINDRLSEL
ncbi:Zn(II)2Cys6 transcription factor domain-containing protein [Aspergillus neoniger CBS 115656]|uniref:Zn(2)-C6 fungal-type domain-containing protein n=1 Tax=Aspergillus neoniger (strain CBS 115656) TaxID=1448310 RepID=A0A318ZP31_ASPNB|nr:hypothetical protein BO87DRAFT_183131 [Aspergillus neoniger CBS 115656]PYH37612.1 hypothetical protein BO87DRAFT_183131 [Aspergillus neoniger CBS 115656]